MNRYLILVNVLFVALAFIVAGCAGPQPPEAPPQPPVTPHVGPVTDYVSLVDNLRAAGADVQPAGDISQPFFLVKGLAITVNGGNVQVFEYADADAADAETALISPDGSSIGTTMVSWVAAPHFYRIGKLIVLYVGDDETVLSVLESVLGQQFAGR